MKNCQCVVCRFSRKEISKEEYKKGLLDNIKRFEKIIKDKRYSEKNKYYAKGNIEETEYLLSDKRLK